MGGGGSFNKLITGCARLLPPQQVAVICGKTCQQVFDSLAEMKQYIVPSVLHGQPIFFRGRDALCSCSIDTVCTHQVIPPPHKVHETKLVHHKTSKILTRPVGRSYGERQMKVAADRLGGKKKEHITELQYITKHPDYR